MISFRANSPFKSHTSAYKVGRKFNVSKYKIHPFHHAESHLISTLLDKYNTIDPNWSIVVMRINRQGIILGSKPCENCSKLLNAVGLRNIYYSDDNGDFVDGANNTVLTIPVSTV